MQRRFLLTLLFLFFCLGNFTSAQAQSDEYCFAETGFCMSGPIRVFWERNGGLTVFGYPITPQYRTDDGQDFQVFERHIIEVHDENTPPYNVQLALIGQYIYLKLQPDTEGVAPPGTPAAGCRWFAETQHNLCGQFMESWSRYGLNLDTNSKINESESLALFGLPITEPYAEVGRDGVSRTVQYFQRARFELHPDNPDTPVQFGLLGREWKDDVLAEAGNAPQPEQPAPAQPTPAPTQTAPTPTPAPAAPTSGVVITREPGTVTRGSTATVGARSAPNVGCDITVIYKSGASTAAGLYPKTTDGNGNVSWSWKVGTRTTPGSWPVIITCGNATARTVVNVP